MNAEIDMLAKLLTEEMVEREADRTEHDIVLAQERARSERLAALEESVAGIQRTLQDLIKALRDAEKKPAPEAKVDMARIEKLLATIKPAKTESRSQEVVFDMVRDELGEVRQIIGRRS